MRRRIIVAVTVGAVLAGCGGEPSERVAVPGAPAAGDTRPPVTTVAIDASTTVPSTASPTVTSTTGPSDTTSTTVAPTTTDTAATAATTTVAPTTTAAPTTTELVYVAEPAEGPLRVGVEGPRSLRVQQDLISLGILPSTAADSKYGPGTAAGVRRFQESQGLVVDGVAGPNTLAALAEAVAGSAPPDTTG